MALLRLGVIVNRPMVVPFVTICCSRCGRFTDVRVGRAGTALCAHCGQRFSAPLGGYDWPNLFRGALAALGIVVIALALTVLIPGGLK